MASLAAFLLIVSRRPDAILNAQFWAEDGFRWFADAYNRGAIYSLTTPEAGYFQTISRIVAIVAQLFPMELAPLIFNLAAIAVMLAVVNFLISTRFSESVPNRYVRCLLAFIYIALPHSFEVHANLTNAQWHLALLSVLIIIAPPPVRRSWKFFDISAIALSSISGPFCLLLLPVALIKAVLRRDLHFFTIAGILAAGAAIQIFALLTSHRPTSQPLGAGIGLFFKILGGHLFAGAVIGERNLYRLIDRNIWTVLPAAIAAFAGTALMIYAFIQARLNLRLLIFFSAMIAAAALISPAASREVPQWTVLWMPGTGVRYWMIPIFTFFICLIFLAKNANVKTVRYLAFALLFFSTVAFVSDWRHRPYQDLNFSESLREFEKLPSGEKMVFPLNPEGEMVLEKR